MGNPVDSTVKTCFSYEVKEQRGFLRNRRGRNLFYALHMPKSEPVKENTWLFCNPFFEEKIFSHGILVQFARFLAAKGYGVMRFDYEGDGDSEGEYNSIDIPKWCDDTLDAVELLRQLYPQATISLFGLRLGALTAGLVARQVRIRSLLFWEPVHDGKKFMADYRKINLTSHLFTSEKEVKDRESLIRDLKTDSTINIAGYDINNSLLQQINQSRLIDVVDPLQRISQIAAIAINRPGMKTNRPEILELASGPEFFAMINSQPFWYGPRFINMQPEDLFESSLELILRLINPMSAKSMQM